MMRLCLLFRQQQKNFLHWMIYLGASWAFFIPSFGQDKVISPPFQSGKWYKIGITKTGIHRIDAAFLKKYGLPQHILSSEKLALFGASPELLPQRIEPGDVPRTKWQEVPLKFQTVRRQKQALFFAESPHQIHWDSTTKQFSHQLHPYTDTTYYYLQIEGETTSKRILSTSPTARVSNLKNKYIDYIFEEKEYQNLVRSGRNWVGDYMSSSLPNRSFKLRLPGYIPNSPIQFTSSVVGASPTNSAQLFLALDEQPPFGTHTLAAIGNGRYDRRGNTTIHTFTTAATQTNPILRYTFQGAQGGVYIDYFGIQFERILTFGEEQTLVQLPSEMQPYKLAIEGPIPSNAHIWEVTHPCTSTEIQNFTHLEHTGQENKKFILFTTEQVHEIPSCQSIKLASFPETEQEIQLLIISPKKWIDQAERLQKYRETEGITGVVWDLEAVYTHFSGGLPDPTALRNLARWYWKKHPETFSYLLLMGDATYDYKNHLQFPTLPPFVPTYQSRESLEPIYSYSSDDYFGFLEETEGEWREGLRINGNWISHPQGNHTLDIGIGRLPVTNWEEAKHTVDKLIAYSEKKEENYGQKRMIWAADDEDFAIHQQDAEQLSTYVETQFPGLNHQKIYIDAFPQTQTTGGERAEKATQTFQGNIQEGALFLNYTGHGSEDILANEQLFTRDLVANWRNKSNAPIWITATCEFGRFDNPSLQSGAEQLILSPIGGATGLFTTTRPVFSNTNFTLNFSLLRAVFEQKEVYLGTIFKLAKNNSTAGVLNRNFTLLGDPSARLPLPSQSIQFASKHGEILRLQIGTPVKISGKTAQQKDGKVQIEIRTSPKTAQTLGNRTPIFAFKEQGKLIFKAEWHIRNGYFDGFITIPSLSELGITGELTAFAVFPDGQQEEIGQIACLFEQVAEQKEDKIPPQISLIRLSSHQFQVRFQDNSGIYLSSSFSDTLQPMYAMNGGKWQRMSQNWQADSLGKSVSQKLIISENTAEIMNLAFVVHDLHTNQTKETFSLEDISEESSIRVHVFPNPIQQFVTFEIEWEANSTDADVSLDFFDLTGKRVFQSVESCYICDHKFNWSLQNSIFEQLVGVYIYRVSIRNRLTNHISATSGRVIFSK